MKKLTSKELIKNYSLDYNILKHLRENKILQFEKRGNSYIYNVNEDLEKSFLLNNTLNNTSITSTEDDIQYSLGSSKIDIPEAGSYGFSNRSKTYKKRYGSTLRDYFIQVFRKISTRPKVSNAIDEIVNELTSPWDDGTVVKIDFNENKNIGETTKKVLIEEWENITNIIRLDNNIDKIAKDWYIDGVIDLEVVYKDNKTGKGGIVQVLKIEPLNFKKIEKDNTIFYTYSQSETTINSTQKGIFKEDQIIEIPSGFWDEEKTFETSYLKTALKAINDLSHVENSIIKYRITRASEKNIWNIDVGSMPNQKAKQHLTEVTNAVKTNLKYNIETGEVSSEVTEGITSDWVFPSRNGKQKTSVDTINGNSDFISKLEDLYYFRKEVYEGLKIPVGRLDAESSLDFSGQDILREELKFSKFIERLKRQLSQLFYELLKRQVISKNKMSNDDWQEIENDIKFKWNSSNVIIENAELENLKTRMESFNELKENNIIGNIVSVEYAVKKILNMTLEEFKEEQERIKKEKTDYPELYKKEDDNY